VAFDVDEAYRIQSSCIKANGYSKHHVDSYEDFMFNKIAACISEYPPVVVRHEEEEHALQIIDYRFGDPSVRESNGRLEPITPAECHLRRITYEVPLIVHAQYTKRNIETGQITHSYIYRDRELDRLPCMKMSALCSLRKGHGISKEDLNEPGGTFLPSGTEKVVIGQEHVRNNFPFVLASSDGSYTCEYRSYNEQKIRSTSTLHIRLIPPFKCDRMAQRKTIVPRILVRVPYVDVDIPVVSMFILLMRENDLDRIFRYLAEDADAPWFRMRMWEIITQDVDASVMDYDTVVSRLMAERQNTTSGDSQERNTHKVVNNINSEFLPNQGYTLEDLPGKTVCFAAYVRKLVRVYYGLQLVDDRDDYMHRRCILNGVMLALLFRKQYTMWRRKLAVNMRHELMNGAETVNIADHLKSNIGAHLHYALSTGNFSMQRQNNNLTGVAQALTRTEPYAALAHMRRNNNPVNKDGKNTKPRLLHPSSLGVICPWDTPEGQPCGLMRNMAILSGIRVGYDTHTLLMVVMMTGLVDAAGRHEPRTDHARVWVNGYLAGRCAVPAAEVIHRLKELRACGDLPHDVSVYLAHDRWSCAVRGEVHVSGDAGSYYWPLIRTDKLDVLRRVLDSRSVSDDILWRELLSQGVIELMSKDEESVSARVAFEVKELVPGHLFTHVMIHPTQICSIATNRGPLIEFNQAPRVTYQAAMGKQAIGPPMTNVMYRADTVMHSLHYPQRPLVETWMDRQLINSCSTNNAIVAIMPESFNMEDSIIINRAAIDRGIFRSSLTRNARTVVRNAENEVLEYPPEGTKSMLFASYENISPEDGLVTPGDQLGPDDVIMSKTTHTSLKKKKDAIVGLSAPETVEKIRDRSVSLKSSEPMTVEKVFLSTTPAEGDTTVRVTTRALRIPQRGDKLASRYGQKGVVGEVRAPEDMPFTATGIIPDLIINPHA
jgi:DNA-directed RNA polymerase II subunit RPB2